MLSTVDHRFSDENILQCATDINSATSTKELIDIWKTKFHAFGFDFLVYNLFSGFEAHEQTPYKRTYVSNCLLYTSPSPRDGLLSRMPSSA